jgi:quercetin dioxygenase-like cupin family protein
MKRKLSGLFALGALLWSGAAVGQQASPAPAAGPPAFVVTKLAEKTVPGLPSGPLVWRIENFATLDQAQAAAGPTSLAVLASGRAWLFTLGPAGGVSPGGTKVAEIGPVQQFAAAHYLLRINEATGPPGSSSPVHSHPGSEAFYVLTGAMSQRTPLGVATVDAGQSMAGREAGISMQVSSSGSTDLHSLVMFVLDGDKPFSSPAAFP